MAKSEGDILKGNTLTLLLSLLAEEPMYGFQIAKEIGRRSEGALRFREGLLYPALHQLEKEGLVEAEWRISTQGPRRKYYVLTSQGKKRAEALKRRWWLLSSAMNRVMGDNGESSR